MSQNQPFVLAAKYPTKENAKKAYDAMQQYMKHHRGQGYNFSGRNLFASGIGYLVVSIILGKTPEQQMQDAFTSILVGKGGEIIELPDQLVATLLLPILNQLPGSTIEGNWREWHSGL